MGEPPQVGHRTTPVLARAPEELTLEEVADAAAMTPRNVRAYQQRGLLPPVTRVGRRLAYGQEHVARLRLVRGLHEHGLSLKVISDLIERGTADHELARLGRQDVAAVWRQAVRVPMDPGSVELYETHRPGTIDALEEAGLVSRDGGRPYASAIGLGLVSALSSRGLDLDHGTRLALMGARGAHLVVDDLRAELDALGDGSEADETRQLMLQLVTTAFADVLTDRLT